MDSASKHILPCKVHTDYLLFTIDASNDNKVRELQNSKDKYDVKQNEVVIGLGRPMYGASIQNSRRKAYPSIISTLGGMDPIARRWLAAHNFLVQDYIDAAPLKDRFLTILAGGGQDPETQELVRRCQCTVEETKAKHVRSLINNHLSMYFMGIALGHAYAHPNDGDTVCSVMCGGLRTVQNGAFSINSGDLLCWYTEDELEFFEEDGSRKDRNMVMIPNNANAGGIAGIDWEKMTKWLIKHDPIKATKVVMGPTETNKRQRIDYHQMENGNFPNGPNGRIQGKQAMFYIKPYRVSRHRDTFRSTPGCPVPQFFPNDRARIFGRAISSSRPYDFLDICISRQAF